MCVDVQEVILTSWVPLQKSAFYLSRPRPAVLPPVMGCQAFGLGLGKESRLVHVMEEQKVFLPLDYRVYLALSQAKALCL